MAIPPVVPFRLSFPACRTLRSPTARRAFSSRRAPSPPRALAPLLTTHRVPHRHPQLVLLESSNNNNNNRNRTIHTTTTRAARGPRKPIAHNREEVPDQPPPTDFERMDVLGATPPPATAVEVCHADGFSLNSGARIGGGSSAGALLVGGEAFAWRPWLLSSSSGKQGRLVNTKGQWEVVEEAFAVLGAVWPRPDLLILGLGPEIRPLSPSTRRAISDLGMRVEVLDTRNAASQYNMLATERGVDDVAAALIPIGWKEGAQ
ncbi:hypothetical protein P885DRAFT_40311 [Corynascus similis CBS 632.67]